MEEAERAVFEDDRTRRYRISRRGRTLFALGIALFPLYFLCIFLPNGVAAKTSLSLAWYLEMVVQNIATFGTWATGGETSSTRLLFIQYIIVALVGSALALSGAVYQGAFRNALASPSTLGVQSGGVLGGTLFVLFAMRDDGTNLFADESPRLLARFGLSFSILLGCLFMVAAVSLAARAFSRSGRMSTLVLVLCGMVFAGGVAEILGLIQYRMMVTNTFDNRTYALRYMLMGSFQGVYTPMHLALISIPVCAAGAVIMAMRGRLNLIVFGEDEARSMGVRVPLIRNLTVGVVTLLTAVVLSFCGMIGFVGLIVPHVARRMVGPDFNYLIPASALLGAASMMLVFHIASALGLATNINMMTSLVGGILFFCMLLYYRRRGHADWA
jgi:iron complex transport system permease protein